jgi:ankyrin repeat protein
MQPIHYAVSSGNVNRVRALLNQGVPVNTRSSHAGWTPLHYASSYGYLNIVKELLRRGARVNPRDHGGRTPLQMASHEGRSRVMSALIKAGANPKYRNWQGNNSYNYARYGGANPNALNTSRAATKWLAMHRKRKAERMLLSPRLLGSTSLAKNQNAIRTIARFLTVKKKSPSKSK